MPPSRNKIMGEVRDFFKSWRKPNPSDSGTRLRRWIRRLLGGKYRQESSIIDNPQPPLEETLPKPVLITRPPPNNEESSTVESLWDRAYDALRQDDPQLVEKYEKLLSDYEQKSNFALGEQSPAELITPDDVSHNVESQSRQAQLKRIIHVGLHQLEKSQIRYTIAGHEFNLTDQISSAAEFVLRAKGLIDAAVKESPEASIAWAGVCIILPLLTQPKVAEDANHDGFIYVTARMDFYSALERSLRQLRGNSEAAYDLMVETENHIVTLYQHILQFQIKSVLRFFQNCLKRYRKDVISAGDWKQMISDIEKDEKTVQSNLSQTHQVASIQQLERLIAKSDETYKIMQDLLSASKDQRDIQQKMLQIQQDEVKQRLSDKEKQCLHSFRLTDSSKDVTYEWYKNRVYTRVDGTCEWFLKHENFSQWLKQDSGPLLVSADPGCGKSVLAKYLIDHILPRSSATICYFFFKDQDQNTVRQALCALLHQLFSLKPSLIKHAMKEFEKNGKDMIHSTASLWTVFGSAMQDPQAGPVVVVLDALDECREEEFRDLVREVGKQYSENKSDPVKLKYFLTSRPYDQITSKFQPLSGIFPGIRIPGEEESSTISREVSCVIKFRVEALAKEKDLPLRIKNHLEDKLLEIKHRTYLWVYLVFDYLTDAIFTRTEDGLDSIMKDLPENVNQAYEKILSKPKDKAIVRKALSLILGARRPLTVSEMNIALNMPIHKTLESIDKPFSLEDDEHFKKNLRSWCGLFVQIYNNRVYFLHQTAREFLLSPESLEISRSERSWQHSITSRSAHELFTTICVQYLNRFNTDFDESPSHQNDTFFEYSAENWHIHFLDAGISKGADIMFLLLRLYNQNLSRLWTCFTALRRHGYDLYNCSDINSLSISSYFGHKAVVELLLEDVNTNLVHRDSMGRTSLMWAIVGGHEGIVQLLLEKSPNLESKDEEGQTPLVLAVKEGNEEIVKLLLEKNPNLESQDEDGLSPLALAARAGNEGVVKLLLEKNPNLESQDKDGLSPLALAVRARNEGIVKLLLEKSPNLESKDKTGQTPLALAAKEGNEEIVKLLLEKNPNLESQDEDGLSPLALAVRARNEGIVKLLLEKSPILESKNKEGQTPLALAAWAGNEGIFKLLLEKSPNLESKDKGGLSPLALAARAGNEGIFKLLLEKSPILESKDKEGRTPLALAAWAGNEGVVKLLLEKGLNLESKDKEGRTPLALAASAGSKGIVKLLLEKGSNLESKDKEGQTPLAFAAWAGSNGMVKLLLEKSSNLESKDKEGQTPLVLAAKYGNEEIVKLLLEKNPNLEHKSMKDRTPLMVAVLFGHEGIVKLLLEKGADIESKDEDGQTPLRYAVETKEDKIARLLREKTYPPNSISSRQISLSFLIKERGDKIVKLLLEKGADVESKDNDGWTPLRWAEERGCDNIATLLMEKSASISLVQGQLQQPDV